MFFRTATLEEPRGSPTGLASQQGVFRTLFDFPLPPPPPYGTPGEGTPRPEGSESSFLLAGTSNDNTLVTPGWEKFFSVPNGETFSVSKLTIPKITNDEILRAVAQFALKENRYIDLPDFDYRLAKIQDFDLTIVPSTPRKPVFERAQWIRTRMGTTRKQLLDSCKALDLHTSCNATITELAPLSDDGTCVDLEWLFDVNPAEDFSSHDALVTAIVDTTYWITEIQNIKAMDPLLSGPWMDHLRHVCPNLLSIMYLPSMIGDDSFGFASKLDSLLHRVMDELEEGLPPLIAQSPCSAAVLSTSALAATCFGVYTLKRNVAASRRAVSSDALNALEMIVKETLYRGAKFAGSIIDWLLKRLEPIYTFPAQIVSYFKEKFISLFDSLVEFFAGKWAKELKFVKCLTGAIVLMFALTVASTGMLTYMAARTALFGCGLRPLPHAEQLEAQGSVQNASFVASFALGLLNLPPSSSAGLKKYAEWIRSVITITSGVNTVFSVILSMLPHTLRRALFLAYASADEVNEERMTELTSFMERLDENSRSPEVLCTPEYKELVAQAMSQSSDIINERSYPSNSDVKRAFMSVFSRLQNVHKHLVSSETPGARDLPFSIHFMGEPGVGKSHSAKHMAHELGFVDGDIYPVPKSAAFWNAYMGQSVIIMDEFLVGNSQKSHDEAITYLDLVGDTPFSPPMASVDNPLVGVKGTQAAPDLVITMNNHHSIHVNHIDGVALRRRRDIVVEVVVLSDAHKTPEGKVDMAYYARDRKLVRNLAWAGFRIHDPFRPRDDNGGFMPWAALIKLLKSRYAAHKDTCKRVAESRGLQTNSRQFGKEMLIRSLQHYGDDSGHVQEALQILGRKAMTAQGYATFSSQGPSSSGKKRPPEVSSKQIGRIPDESEEPAEDPFKGVMQDNTPEVSSQEVKEPPAELPLNSGSKWGTFSTIAGRISTVTTLVLTLAGVAEVCRRLLGTKEPGLSVQSLEVESRRANNRARPKNKAYSSRVSVEKAAEWNALEWHTQGPPRPLVLTFNETKAHGVGICDRFILTFAHSLLTRSGELPMEHTPITLTVGPDVYNGTIRHKDLYIFPSSDLAIIYFDCKTLPAFGNVIKHFVDDRAMADTACCKAEFGLPGDTIVTSVDVVDDVSYKCYDRIQDLAFALYYQLDTKRGDCGKLLRSVSGACRGKYIGMHVAGMNNPAAPEGMATIVTQEILKHGVSAIEKRRAQSVPLDSQGNLLYCDECDGVDMMVLNRKTKLTKSMFYDKLDPVPTHEPAVLHENDPRGNGTSPVGNFLAAVNESIPWVKPDPIKLARIASETTTFIRDGLRSDYRYRRLTIDEAVKGIPGFLKSMNAATSPGYPYDKLATKRGKRDFFYFDENGNCIISDHFRQLVTQKLVEMECGVYPDHKWVGYLKDELLPQSKIAINKTRVIFAGDVVTMAALRVHFGMVIGAFNNAESDTGISIGSNQYSFDMDIIHKRLLGPHRDGAERFVAGDFRGYDKRYVEDFRDAAYGVLATISKEFGVSDSASLYLYRYDTKSPAIIGPREFKSFVSFFSGGLFTTILNSIINHLYVRYAFQRAHPGRRFDDCISMVAHGDDHIVNVRDPTVDFDAVIMAKYLSEINQEYTSDDKTDPKPGYRSFEEITFLGASPVKYDGRYVGQMKRSSIFQMLSHTRDGDDSALAVGTTAIEFASFHDTKFFSYISDLVLDSLQSHGIGNGATIPIDQERVRRVVAGRTAASGYRYIPGFISFDEPALHLFKPRKPNQLVAQHTRPRVLLEAQGDAPPGSMTVFRTDRDITSSRTSSTNRFTEGLNAETSTQTYGTDSYVRRDDFQWATTDTAGTILASYSLPWGLLNQGSTQNFQNLPFTINSYWRGDVKVTIQVNGPPFVSGILVMYFYPLTNGSTLDIKNWTSCQHVMLSANANTTATLDIPFNYPRNAMNTRINDDTNAMGFVHIGVIAPMRAEAANALTVSIYSSFPNSQFSLPRSTVLPSYSTVSERAGQRVSGKRPKGEMEAQGNYQSTTTVNKYDISDVAGSVPVQTETNGSQDAKASSALQLPMHKPPLSSGAVPMQNAFSGMSKSVGLNPCTSMQLAPTASYRQGGNNFLDEDVDIGNLLNRPSLLNSYTLTTLQAADTTIAAFSLDSVLNKFAGGMIVPHTTIGANAAILNAFVYWRADICFDIVLARTIMHSTRLMSTVGYGELETDSVMRSDRNSFINTVLDFNGSTDRQTVRIPYNQSVEYLRTYEGDYTGVNQFDEGHSLGFFNLSVANKLTATDAVADTVDILIFLRFENASVAVPRPLPFWHVETFYSGPQQETEDLVMHFEAQGGEPGDSPPLLSGESTPVDATGKGAVADDPGAVQPYALTNTGAAPNTAAPCNISLGHRFECTPKTTVEVDRRYVQTLLNPKTSTIDGFTDVSVNTYVSPRGIFAPFYAAYSGGINLRFYQDTHGRQRPIMFYPQHINTEDYIANSATRDYFGHLNDIVTEIVVTGDGTIPDKKLKVVESVGLGVPVTRELLYPISQNGWIDVNIPFQSNYNFICTESHNSASPATRYGSSLGVVNIPVNQTAETDYPAVATFVALADDASYGLYRPPLVIRWQPLGTSTMSEDARNVGGFWNPNYRFI